MMLFGSILFVFFTLSLNISLLLVKKSDSKLNIVVWIPVTLLLVICIDALFAGLINLVFLPVNLLSMTIVNAALTGACLVFMYRRKERQSYEAPWLDLVALGAFILVTAVCAYIQFGLGFNLNFGTSDPAAHLMNSWVIVDTGRISGMYLSHLPIALAIETATPFMAPTHYYQVFIIVEVFFLFLSAAVFYSAARRYASSRIASVTLIIMALLYMLGFPLNNLVFGFSYLGLSVTVVALVFFGIASYQKRDIYPWCSLTILMLALFALIISYALFVPAVFVAVLIFLVIIFKQQGRVFSKRNMAVLLYLFAPAIVLGYLYTYQGFFGDSMQIGVALGLDGGVYRELYADFLFITPLLIYALFDSFRTKEHGFEDVLFPALFVMMLVGLIAGLAGLISAYYFFKFHYLMWLVAFLLATRGLIVLFSTKGAGRNFAAVYCSSVLALMLFGATGIDKVIYRINERFNPMPSLIPEYPAYPGENSPEAKSRLLFNIYVFNFYNIKTDSYISPGQIDLFEEAYRLTDNRYVPIVAATGDQFSWYHAITLQEISSDFPYGLDSDALTTKLKKSEYFVVLLGAEEEKSLEPLISRGEIIFENSEGSLVKLGN